MRRASIAAVLLASSAGGAAFGQGFEGSTITATVSERFEANDNYDLDDPSPGTSYFADTRLTLGFLNQTPTQNFELGFSTGLRALWQAEQPFEFTLASPTGASLDYDNAWADGLFDMSFDYRQRQVDYTEAISADDDPNQLPDDLSQLQNNTREMRYDANIGVAFGTSTPSSYELRFIGSQVDYTDVTPDQVPRSTLEGQAAWNLQFNPILASRVTGDYLYYNADNSDQTELRRASVGAGVVYTPDVNTSLGLGVNYADRQRKDLVNDALETTESNNGPGITGEFSYTTEELVFSGEGEWSSAAPTTRRSARPSRKPPTSSRARPPTATMSVTPSTAPSRSPPVSPRTSPPTPPSPSRLRRSAPGPAREAHTHAPRHPPFRPPHPHAAPPPRARPTPRAQRTP
mgnify:CR=1 FL=1